MQATLISRSIGLKKKKGRYVMRESRSATCTRRRRAVRSENRIKVRQTLEKGRTEANCRVLVKSAGNSTEASNKEMFRKRDLFFYFYSWQVQLNCRHYFSTLPWAPGTNLVHSSKWLKQAEVNLPWLLIHNLRILLKPGHCTEKYG